VLKLIEALPLTMRSG